MPETLLPEDDSLQKGHRSRLRERFLKGGAEALAEYELLEMILFAAHPRGDVKPLAKQLIKHFGSFSKVIQAEIHALQAISGLGDAGIAAIKAIEISVVKLLKQQVMQGTVISNWTSLLDYCRVAMGSKKREEFRVLYLNNKNVLISDEVQQTGTINHTPVYPREVVKRALECGAASIIIVHNHPSGDPTPSKADIEMTYQVVEAAKTVEVKVYDHLVIGSQGHYSFRSHGLISA